MQSPAKEKAKGQKSKWPTTTGQELLTLCTRCNHAPERRMTESAEQSASSLGFSSLLPSTSSCKESHTCLSTIRIAQHLRHALRKSLCIGLKFIRNEGADIDAVLVVELGSKLKFQFLWQY